MKDGKPGLLISSACEQLTDELSTLLTSKTDPEDVDTTQDDHLFDTTKYLLTNVALAQEPQKYTQTISPIAEMFG